MTDMPNFDDDTLRRLFRAAADKSDRLYPRPTLRPATVLAVDGDPSKALIYAEVQFAADDQGNATPCVSLIGAPTVGDQVMVYWDPPQGMYILGRLTREESATPVGWAYTTTNLDVPDQTSLPSLYTLMTFDEWVGTSTFFTAFESKDWGFRALRDVTIDVDYTLQWDNQGPASNEIGLYESALLLSGSTCTLEQNAAYGCQDQHLYTGSEPSVMGTAGSWVHGSSTKLTMRAGEDIAVGARYFAQTSPGPVVTVTDGVGCDFSHAVRLSIHLVDLLPVELEEIPPE